MMHVDYFIVESKGLDSEADEIFELLKGFDFLLKKRGLKQAQVLKLTVFYKPNIGKKIALDIEESIVTHFKHSVPALSIIAQPPFGKGTISMEVGYLASSNALIAYKKYKNVYYTVATEGKDQQIFVSGICSTNLLLSKQNLYEHAFETLEDILCSEGFTFSDIIRQWNYIQDIIETNEGDQNYQIFNDVRTRYYSKNGLTSNYPAATGIGIKEGGIVLEVHALRHTDDLQLAEIENPMQTSAFSYSEKVLEGKPIIGYMARTTPKFSRAKFIANKQLAQVLVSGTAAIHGENTVGVNDIENQTRFTIENINKLIEKDYLAKINSKCRNANLSAGCIRVYVKNANDIDIVRKVCKEYYEITNIVFVEADICRNNLLVEIEGVFDISFGF